MSVDRFAALNLDRATLMRRLAAQGIGTQVIIFRSIASLTTSRKSDAAFAWRDEYYRRC